MSFVCWASDGKIWHVITILECRLCHAVRLGSALPRAQTIHSHVLGFLGAAHGPGLLMLTSLIGISEV